MVLPKASRQKRGVAAPLENSLLLGFGQRAAKLRFFIFHLRTDIFRKLPDDVFALGLRQTLGDCVQVAIKQVQGVAPSHNPVQGRINALPLCEQALQNHLAVGGEAVKPFVALVFFAPFAEEQPLALEPAEKRIQGAFIDGDTQVAKRFAERVTVVLFTEGGEDGENQRAAAQLQPQVFEELVVVCTGCHIVYDIHCMAHSIDCQVLFLRDIRAGRVYALLRETGHYESGNKGKMRGGNSEETGEGGRRGFVKRLVVAAVILWSAACAGELRAQKPPLLPEKDVAALANELSGETAKRNLEGIARFHRQRGSQAFHAAAELVAERARAYGLSDVAILQFPADGKIFYGTQRSRPAWDAEVGELI